MNYENTVENLQSEFEENPLNFFVEAELQARLKQLIQQEISGETKIADTKNFPGTEKHREFTDKALETDSINRTHLEVKTSQEGGNIDLCVFQQEASVEMSGGTKVFDAEDLEAAFELKFVKNLDYAQPGKVSDIRSDIKRLDRLPDHIEKYVIIFANKNIFRDSPQTDYSDRLPELQQESDDVTVYYSHIPVQQD
jgi:hypothetical protein